jgi:hypothetical protein
MFIALLFEVPVQVNGRSFERSLAVDVVSGHHHVW